MISISYAINSDGGNKWDALGVKFKGALLIVVEQSLSGRRIDATLNHGVIQSHLRCALNTIR